jgi:hypothetical protein
VNMLGRAFWWIPRGSAGSFERDVGFGGLGRWENLICQVIPLAMSFRIDPNHLPPYNFNNCFSVGVLIAGLVGLGLLSGEDQPLLVRWNTFPEGGVPC